MQPLSELKVIDFTSLTPGPLATLILAEAGARVIKVERAEGDPIRANPLKIGGEAVQFAMLNRGKTSIVADLKQPDDKAAILQLIQEADVLIEQFRPGVMERLGLGFNALSKLNPRLIYCSITGFGQNGPDALRAGHDLNYLARNGMLSLGGGAQGEPVLPPGLIADFGGGTLPAVINILLALIQRDKTGSGCHIDIAMTEMTFAWMSRALAGMAVSGSGNPAEGNSHTGATPRYGLYRAADGKYLAVGALESKFWQEFCDVLALPDDMRAASADPKTVKAEIARRIGGETSDHWEKKFAQKDCCVEIVRDVAEAVNDRHFSDRKVFAQKLKLANGQQIAALPVPLAQHFLADEIRQAPLLGPSAGGKRVSWRS